MTTPDPTSWGLEHTKSKRKELIKRIGWEDPDNYGLGNTSPNELQLIVNSPYGTYAVVFDPRESDFIHRLICQHHSWLTIYDNYPEEHCDALDLVVHAIAFWLHGDKSLLEKLPSKAQAYFENNLNVQEVEDTLRNAILRVDVSCPGWRYKPSHCIQTIIVITDFEHLMTIKRPRVN